MLTSYDSDIYNWIKSHPFVKQEVTEMALLMKPEPFSSEFNRLFNTLFDQSQTAALGSGDGPGRARRPLLAAGRPARPERGRRQHRGPRQHADRSPASARRSTSSASAAGTALERQFGQFSRSLTLPEGVNPDAIQASFDARRARGTHPEAGGAQAAPGLDRGRQRPVAGGTRGAPRSVSHSGQRSRAPASETRNPERPPVQRAL